MARRRYTFKDKRRSSGILPRRRRRISRRDMIFGHSAASTFFSRNKRDVLIVSAVVVFFILALLLFNRWQLSILMEGEENQVLEWGEAWEDPGAKARVSGSVLKFVGFNTDLETEDAVDTSKVGTYQVKYRAEYKGKTAEAVRTVEVKDSIPPEIVLTSDPKLSIAPGEEYEEEGFRATDQYDGDITDKVVREEADGVIRYTAVDSSGNKTVVERPIPYEEEASSVEEESMEEKYDGEGKTIYLTFDEGPGPYTERLLKILDDQGVKATFFVSGADPENYHCISLASNAGHTIGVYSYGRDYGYIYSYVDAFWEDFVYMEDVILEQTGYTTPIMRFPGGSGGAISEEYSPGLMEELRSLATQMGYVYFDWNVDSGDGGKADTSDRIYRNIVDGVKDKEQSIVLCHDANEHTVDAVERVIRWGLDNGYEFRALDEWSFTAHE